MYSGKYRREFRRAFCCSPGLRHETSTTLTRFTTYRRKFDQSFDKGQTCNRNTSLKAHNCNHTPLTRGYTCDGISFPGNRCERLSLKGQRCDYTSCNGQKCNRLDLNGHRCDRTGVTFKGQSCYRPGSQNMECDVSLNNGQRQYERFPPYNQNEYRKNYMS